MTLDMMPKLGTETSTHYPPRESTTSPLASGASHSQAVAFRKPLTGQVARSMTHRPRLSISLSPHTPEEESPVSLYGLTGVGIRSIKRLMGVNRLIIRSAP